MSECAMDTRISGSAGTLLLLRSSPVADSDDGGGGGGSGGSGVAAEASDRYVLAAESRRYMVRSVQVVGFSTRPESVTEALHRWDEYSGIVYV